MSLLQNHQPKVGAQASWGNPRHPECTRGPAARDPTPAVTAGGGLEEEASCSPAPLHTSQAEQFLPGPTVKAQDPTWAEKPSQTHHGRAHPSLTKHSTEWVQSSGNKSNGNKEDMHAHRTK